MTDFDVAHVEPGGQPHRYAVAVAGDGPTLSVAKLSVGPYDNNVYIVADPDAGEALIVDAANEGERVLAQLGGLTVVGVVTTHRHPDHSFALRDVLRATGTWSGAHEGDADDLPVRPDRLLSHGDTIQVGAFAVGVLHTPGHTDGSISFTLPHPQVLTGDALFPGGVGKTTGPEAFAQAIASAERHLFTLDAATRVSPGHGDDTTVATEVPHLEEWRSRGW
jgi:glyoxylase-like metal-dependent hydrolase (beta-lactamase superfamily II)